jgi:PilZ domain
MRDSERRLAKRITYFAEAELDGLDVGHRLQVRLADLSTGGAFVDARSVLPAGAKATLTFTVLGRPISVLSQVRYSMPSFGMGVRFLDLRPEDRAVIEEFIRQQP